MEIAVGQTFMARTITETNRVLLKACDSYDSDKLSGIIRSMLDSIAAENKIDLNGKKITIKPNLLAIKSPDMGITTSPVFVRETAAWCIEKGATVTIADSPGGIYNQNVLKSLYKTTGMQAAAESSGAVLNFDTASREVPNSGKAISRFSLINPVADCDVLINLCRLKTHALCDMTAAVKNMYGTIPGLLKAEMHARFPKIRDFAAMLIELCMVAAPTINIVDAIICMEGNGPAGGSLKKVGAVIGGANPFAIDTLCAAIMGYDNSEVVTLAAADKAGKGFSIDELNIEGDDYHRFVSKFIKPDSTAGGLLKQLPRILGGKIGKMLEPRPYIDVRKCVGCGKCAECCPASAIKVEKGRAVIKRRSCIKCYCCQELCPKKAVEIK